MLTLVAPISCTLQEKHFREKMKMGTPIVDQSGANAAAQPSQTKAEKHASPVDKFAEARRAKKKEKRVRHRAKLRRSHTDG